MNTTNIREESQKWYKSISGGEFSLIATKHGFTDLFEIDKTEIDLIYMKEHPQPTSLLEQMDEVTKRDSEHITNIDEIVKPELREMAILRIARKSLWDVNFNAWHVADEAAKWQKEQSDIKIQQLTTLLRNLTNTCMASDFNEHWDSYLSAMDYLKTNKS